MSCELDSTMLYVLQIETVFRKFRALLITSHCSNKLTIVYCSSDVKLNGKWVIRCALKFMARSGHKLRAFSLVSKLSQQCRRKTTDAKRMAQRAHP